MCSPLKLIYSHYPDKTKDQYLQPPITRPEFINQPHYKSEFFEAGLSLVRYFGCEVEAVGDNIILDIEQVKMDKIDDRIIAHLDWNGQNIDTVTQKLSKTGPKGGLINRVRGGCPTRGAGILKIFYFKAGENSVNNNHNYYCFFYLCISSIVVLNKFINLVTIKSL